MIATVYSHGQATTLEVHGRQDIEELIARCGWTIENDAILTNADRAVIAAIRQQGYAESMGLGGSAALDWWHEHTVNVLENVLTPDM
jgi:hypothetical protein